MTNFIAKLYNVLTKTMNTFKRGVWGRHLKIEINFGIASCKELAKYYIGSYYKSRDLCIFVKNLFELSKIIIQ